MVEETAEMCQKNYSGKYLFLFRKNGGGYSRDVPRGIKKDMKSKRTNSPYKQMYKHKQAADLRMVEETAEMYRAVTQPYVEREELGDRIRSFQFFQFLFCFSFVCCVYVEREELSDRIR